MMSKICFVSYEIHPTVKGGCGVFLYNAANILLSAGHEVVFVLDIEDVEFNQFNEIDRLSLPNAGNCRAYQVSSLSTDIEIPPSSFTSVYEYRSYRFHWAVSKIYQLEKPHVIEFFEYTGVAYCALSAKIAGLEYQETHLAVRLHGSLEQIDRYQPGNLHEISRYLMFGLERQAMRLAESVLYPSRTYYEMVYEPQYESWFGRKYPSQPPLMGTPESFGKVDNPDIILYYGRLHGIKGVDTFVDAAILYLSNPKNPPRKFYLVGYDTFTPPTNEGSYENYLRQKIPFQFQEFFYFTGQLSWESLGKLLPQVLFAVIPSYFESFCYAAHELYEAGIPLIVSKIPAFQDYFHHMENALVFDGSVSDLFHQIELLSIDNQLRQRITHPTTIDKKPLGDFYSLSSYPSWIQLEGHQEPFTLLVCILCENEVEPDQTIHSLKQEFTDSIKIVLLHPNQEGSPENIVTWFLGKLYYFTGLEGEGLQPAQVITGNTLLILKAGDIVEPGMIRTGLSTLHRQPQIAFVGCWKRWIKGNDLENDLFPLDAVPELLPLTSHSPFSRFIMRTPPEKLLIDLFDPRAARLGEVDYLWKINTDANCGILIPEVLATCVFDDERSMDSTALDYLFNRDDDNWRKSRLSRYLLTLPDRRETLKKPLLSQRKERFSIGSVMRRLFYKLGSSRLSKWMDRFPGLKKALKKSAEILLVRT